MFRTAIIAIFSALALSGFLASPASAQHLHGNVHHGFAPGHFHHHHDHGYGYRHHDYHYGHENDYEYGHVPHPSTALIRHHAIPLYIGADCPYGNDAIGSHSFGCPLQRGRALPNSLNDRYQPSFGLRDSNPNHSHSGDTHGGLSHDGHSHEGHTHDRLNPRNNNIAPSDQEHLAPPSLPPGTLNDAPARQRLQNDQSPRDDSIRMDGPPPSTVAPSSPSQSNSNNPRQFDTPPPPTL